MTVLALPYGSRVAVGALLAGLDDLLESEGHTDFVVGNNIGTDATHDTYPFVRVSQVGGSIAEPESIYWLADTVLQIDVWGPGGNDRFAAHTIAEAAARVLVSLSGSVEYTIGTSTVTAVVSRCVVGVVTDTTDTALAPPRPYSRFDAVLTAHPQPNTGS